MTLAVLAGIAGGLVIAGIAGARRTDTALARHLHAYRFSDATVFAENVAAEGNRDVRTRRRLAQLGTLPQVQASALDSELAYCARDAKNRPVIDTGPQAVLFLVSIDGRDGVALNRPKLLAGRNVDPTQPREALLDSRVGAEVRRPAGGRYPDSRVPLIRRIRLSARSGATRATRVPFQSGQPTRREVRQILVSCPKPRPCNEAKAVIDRLYARLEKGADFARLAKKFSDDPGGSGAWRSALDHPRSDRRAVQHDGLPPTDRLDLATAEDALRLAHRAAADARPCPTACSCG